MSQENYNISSGAVVPKNVDVAEGTTPEHEQNGDEDLKSQPPDMSSISYAISHSQRDGGEEKQRRLQQLLSKKGKRSASFDLLTKRTNPRRLMQEKGKVVYYKKQILRYDSERLVSFGVFDTVHGTIFRSGKLWMKLCSLIILATTTALAVRISLGPDEKTIKEFNTDQFEKVVILMSSLIAFLLGLYISMIISRWWTIRDNCVGDLWDAINTICMYLASFMGQDAEDDLQTQKLILRYGLLAHALIYVRAREMMNKELGEEMYQREREEELKKLIEKGLLSKEEKEFLEEHGGDCKAQVVWVWVSCFLHRLILNDPRIPDFLCVALSPSIRGGRSAIQRIFVYLDTQLPMPYVHMLSFLVNAYHIALAIHTGVVSLKGVWSGHLTEAMVQFLILVLFCVLYQGIMELAEKLSNPLGNDDVDLPEAAYHNFIQEECEAFFMAGRNLTWLTQEEKDKEKRKHQKLKEKQLLKEMNGDDELDMDMPDIPMDG